MADILPFTPVQPKSPSIGNAIADGLEQMQWRILSKHVRVGLELDAATSNLSCLAEWRVAIVQMLDLAIARSPDHGEVLVVGLQTDRGIEIEVSDEGDTEQLARNNAFGNLAAHSKSEMLFSRCPQGGMACTLVLTIPLQKTMAA